MKMPKRPSLPKAFRPPKPLPRLQNLKGLPGLGQSEGVTGHWRFDTRTNKHVWVKAHWRKP